MNPQCPARRVLELIAAEWTVMVVYTLAEGTKRYSQLQREIDGISQKMLTQTLRRLEQDGLVERTVYPVVPPMVEYALTELGRTLIGPLSAIGDWAMAHSHEVEAAQARYKSKTKLVQGMKQSERRFAPTTEVTLR